MFVGISWYNAFRGLLGSSFEASGGAVLGPLRVFLGSLGGLLGASWRPLAALLGSPGALSGRKIKCLNFWSPSRAPLGPFSGPSWALVGAFRAVFGASLAGLGQCSGYLWPPAVDREQGSREPASISLIRW